MTKKKIAWIIDTTAHLTDELLNHPDVYITPLSIHFSDEQFVDGDPENTSYLYDKINSSEEIPKTSQPSTGSFVELYTKLKETYDGAIAVHISSKISGTPGSSKAGAEMAGFDVRVVDSLAMSYGITFMVERSMEVFEETNDIDKAEAVVRSLIGKMTSFVLIGNLKQLYRGGRMSGVQYFVGSLLRVKPVVQMSPEGELFPLDKVRSDKRGFQYLVDRAVERKDFIKRRIAIVHGNAPERAEQLKIALQEAIPGMEVRIGEISSTIAVHAGEKTLAILWFEEEGTHDA